MPGPRINRRKAPRSNGWDTILFMQVSKVEKSSESSIQSICFLPGNGSRLEWNSATCSTTSRVSFRRASSYPRILCKEVSSLSKVSVCGSFCVVGGSASVRYVKRIWKGYQTQARSQLGRGYGALRIILKPKLCICDQTFDYRFCLYIVENLLEWLKVMEHRVKHLQRLTQGKPEKSPFTKCRLQCLWNDLKFLWRHSWDGDRCENADSQP